MWMYLLLCLQNWELLGWSLVLLKDLTEASEALQKCQGLPTQISPRIGPNRWNEILVEYKSGANFLGRAWISPLGSKSSTIIWEHDAVGSLTDHQTRSSFSSNTIVPCSFVTCALLLLQWSFSIILLPLLSLEVCLFVTNRLFCTACRKNKYRACSLHSLKVFFFSLTCQSWRRDRISTVQTHGKQTLPQQL